MKNLIILILFSMGFFANCQVVQLIDSNSKISLNFEAVSDSKGFPIDGIVYRKKGTQVYKLVNDGVLDVKLFGAKGDGVTDDTQAIQKAFDFLFNVKKVKTLNQSGFSSIKLSAGNYRITDTLYFPTGFVLEGTGKSTSNIFYDKLSGNALEIRESRSRANQFENFDYTTLKNFSLGGRNSKDRAYMNHTPNNTNNGILLFQVLKIKINNVEVSFFENSGILADSIYYFNIFDCYLHNNVYGLQTKGTSLVAGASVNTSIVVDNSEIRWNSIGIYFKSAYACVVTNSIIETNVYDYNKKTFDPNIFPISTQNSIGILLEDANNMKISNNYVESHNCSIFFLRSGNNVIRENLVVPGDIFRMPTTINPETGLKYFYSSFVFYDSSYNQLLLNGFLVSDPEILKTQSVFTPSSQKNFWEFLDAEAYNEFNTIFGSYVTGNNVKTNLKTL